MEGSVQDSDEGCGAPRSRPSDYTEEYEADSEGYGTARSGTGTGLQDRSELAATRQTELTGGPLADTQGSGSRRAEGTDESIAFGKLSARRSLEC